MSTAPTAAQTQLDEHMDALIVAGAGLEDILAELERLGLVDDEPMAFDDDGRPLVVVDCLDEQAAAGVRNWFNIRDRAAAKGIPPQDLAQWAINQYRKAMTAIAEANEAAARQAAIVEAWRAEQVKKSERDAAFFEGVLDQYQQDFGGGERTVKLVGGNLKLTKNRELISWQEDRAREWALQQPNVDDLCPRGFAKSAVKSLLTKRPDGSYVLAETGEVVDWVKDIDPPTADTFKVELT